MSFKVITNFSLDQTWSIAQSALFPVSCPSQNRHHSFYCRWNCNLSFLTGCCWLYFPWQRCPNDHSRKLWVFWIPSVVNIYRRRSTWKFLRMFYTMIIQAFWKYNEISYKCLHLSPSWDLNVWPKECQIYLLYSILTAFTFLLLCLILVKSWIW